MNTEELVNALRGKGVGSTIGMTAPFSAALYDEAADTIERQAEAIRVLREALALLVENAKHGDFVSETRIETAEHALDQTKEFGE